MLTPPTDSLYKFLAIFGIVLFVTGSYLDTQARRSFHEAATAKLVEIAKAGQLEIEQSRQQGALVKQMGAYDAKTKDGLEHIAKIASQLNSPELSRSYKDFESSESYIRAEQAYEDAKKEYLKSVSDSSLLTLGGPFIAAAGFVLWYFKIQRFLDHQLASKSIEVTNAKNGGAEVRSEQAENS